jgi:hypothetical protein
MPRFFYRFMILSAGSEPVEVDSNTDRLLASGGEPFFSPLNSAEIAPGVRIKLGQPPHSGQLWYRGKPHQGVLIVVQTELQESPEGGGGAAGQPDIHPAAPGRTAPALGRAGPPEPKTQGSN